MNHDPTLGFLVADIGRLIRRAFQQQLSDDDLTYTQARTLVFISRQEGLRQVELAERMEIQPITLARLIDQLETQQLVERRPDPRDRRAYLLYLTPAAEQPLARFRDLGTGIYDQMLDGISETKRRELEATLTRIRGNLCGS